MNVRLLAIAMLGIPAAVWAQNTSLICAESDPAIRLELQAADDKILQVDGAARDQTAEMLAKGLIDRYPDDFIVHIRYQQWIRGTIGPAAFIERYESLAAAHPGNPMFAVLYAQALRGTNAPQAIELLKSAAASPLDPWVHLTLGELYSSGKSADPPEARTQLDAWFGACPATLNWNALSSLVRYGSPATVAKEAALLRAKLESEAEPHLLLSWRFVWDMEFKARPAAEHAALRQQIALDVARLETMPAPNDNRWPELLAAGHKLARDPEPRAAPRAGPGRINGISGERRSPPRGVLGAGIKRIPSGARRSARRASRNTIARSLSTRHPTRASETTPL